MRGATPLSKRECDVRLGSHGGCSCDLVRLYLRESSQSGHARYLKRYLDENKGDILCKIIWTNVDRDNGGSAISDPESQSICSKVNHQGLHPVKYGSCWPIFSAGSGTHLAVAENSLVAAGLAVISLAFAIHITRKRLLDIEGCRPFEILNLGKYERQYWQGVTFGEQGQAALLSRHSMNTWPLSSSFTARSRWPG